jgi:hypothetical protein
LSPAVHDPAVLHDALQTGGYAVMPSLVSQAECASYDAALEREWRRVGEPALFSQEDVHIEEGMHVSPVGLACGGILQRIPALADFLLRPALLAFFERVLGEGFELELGSGVVSDASRGFLTWHHHAGGIDEPDLRRKEYPHGSRVERIGCTLYTAPLGGDLGTLLVHPRPVDSPTQPPFEPGREPWPGAQELHAPAGSVVFLDQGTWHAVSPKRGPGHRHFFAFFVRRAGLAQTKRRDESIAHAFAERKELARAYGGAR